MRIPVPPIPASRPELLASADEYERWAIGVLDQITDSQDAVDLLTCTPVRTEDGSRPDSVAGRTVALWPHSVLDEAMSSPHPARRFAAHRHCQYVLDLYLVGIYRGSIASLPMGTSVLRVLLQSSFQLLQPLCYGRFPLESCVSSRHYILLW